jgi:hypothetical protein
MTNVNQKRSDIQSQVLGTQTMHIHFIYEKEYFRVCHMVRIPVSAIIAIMVLIIERMVNRLYIYSTQEMNLIGPLYDTLFLKEKCHSKWH